MSDVFGFLKDGVKKRAWAICLVTLLYKLYLKDVSFLVLGAKYDDYITLAFILSFTSLFSDFLYYTYSTIVGYVDYRLLVKSRKILEKIEGRIEFCDNGDIKFDRFISERENNFSRKIIGKIKVYAEKNTNSNLYDFYKDKTSLEINTLVMSKYVMNGLTKAIDDYYAGNDNTRQGKQLITMLEAEKERVGKLKLFTKEIYSETVYLESKFGLIKIIDLVLEILLFPYHIIDSVVFLPLKYKIREYWVKKNAM